MTATLIHLRSKGRIEVIGSATASKDTCQCKLCCLYTRATCQSQRTSETGTAPASHISHTSHTSRTLNQSQLTCLGNVHRDSEVPLCAARTLGAANVGLGPYLAHVQPGLNPAPKPDRVLPSEVLEDVNHGTRGVGQREPEDCLPSHGVEGGLQTADSMCVVAFAYFRPMFY